jgi:chemotaxis protein histidine kinase CheA
VNRSLLLLVSIALLGGCDSKKDAAAEAERLRIETDRKKNELERAENEKEKARLAQEKKAAEEKAIADKKEANEAEAKRIEAERARLDKDRENLAAERKRLENKGKMIDSEAAAQEEATARQAEQEAALKMAAAKSEEERQKLEAIRARAEIARQEAEKAMADALAREAAAKRAQEIAMKQTSAIFYTALEGMGDWFETDRYGFVWRPYVAAQNDKWRPYADGRWLCTDYGWTWQSNEPFGWAAYHYGRWAKLTGTGWVWVPGSEWAPAWVAWRWHRPREFVGWAPLPPESKDARTINTKVDVEFDIGPGNYGFIAIADFDAPTYVGKFLPESRLEEIMPLTMNVSYLAPRAGGGMVCGGPDMGLINTELRRLRNDLEIKPVQRVGVQLLNAAATSAAPDSMDAGALMLFAPQLKPIPPIGKPKKLTGRVEVRHSERGWDPSNPWQTDQWRAKIRADAAAVDAAERAAAARPAPAPVVAPPRPSSAPTPTPVPRPVVNTPRQPGPPKPGTLSPSSLEPSSPLFPKR